MGDVHRACDWRLERDVDPRVLGHELGVAQILEGTVRRAGERSRIRVRLVDTRSRQPVWAEHFVAREDEPFEVRDRRNRTVLEAAAGWCRDPERAIDAADSPAAAAERRRRPPCQNGRRTTARAGPELERGRASRPLHRSERAEKLGATVPDSSPTPIVLSWSSGKDCAWALHVLRADPRYEVVGLLTTVSEPTGRVAMHAVRAELLAAQARAVGLPLETVALPDPCPNEVYEERMGEAVAAARARGVEGVAFGDLHLEDVRAYRERQMEGTGLSTHFPLWGRDTRALAEEMVAAGARAVLTSVDPRQCPRALAGRTYDAALLRELPDGVDPCGEYGEFHTFATDGPAFAAPVAVERGDVVERGGFVFADLVPSGASEAGR